MNAISRRDKEPMWEVLVRHWQRLTPAERRRVRELLTKFRGRPSNLSKREQRELRDLVSKLDAPVLARELYKRRDRVSRARLPRR